MFNRLKNWIRGKKDAGLDFRYCVLPYVSLESSSSFSGMFYRNPVLKCIVESINLSTSRVYFPKLDRYDNVPTGCIFDTYDSALKVASNSGLLIKHITPEILDKDNPLPVLSKEEMEEIKKLESNPKKVKKLIKKLMENK